MKKKPVKKLSRRAGKQDVPMKYYHALRRDHEILKNNFIGMQCDLEGMWAKIQLLEHRRK